MDSIPERLKYYREKNELTSSDVAYMLGIPEAEYCAMEIPGEEVPLKFVVKLLRFYKLESDAFFIASAEKVSQQVPYVTTPIGKTKSPETKANPGKPLEENIDKNSSGIEKLTGDFELEKPRKPLTPKQAASILKKHGTEVTEDEAEKVLSFMRCMAEIAVDQAMKTADWDLRLKKEPQGFLFEEKGYTCRICRYSAQNGWYDHAGLRCGICQQAILMGSYHRIFAGRMTFIIQNMN